MVIQANQDTDWWGWADAGEKIVVTYKDASGTRISTAHTAVSKDGRWMLKLPKMAAGISGAVEVKEGENNTRTLQDVITGEVWLGAGQSNMEFTVGAGNVPPEIVNQAQEEAGAAKSNIRFFQVTKMGADEPQKDVQGAWVVIAPENVRQVSSVAWNFAQALNVDLKTPVGMIVAAWGGTPVEAWIPRDTLDATSVGAAVWKRHQELIAKFTPEEVKRLQAQMKEWNEANPTPELKKKISPRARLLPIGQHAASHRCVYTTG